MNSSKKNILIAMDSFKGSLSSKEAGEAVQRGISNYNEICSHVISVADGGEGSLDAIYNMVGGEWCSVQCVNAFHMPIQCEYLISRKGNDKIAYVESAKVIGLHDIKPNNETVRKTSSYGLGELISSIMKQGIENIVVFLGGTITTDGGLGLIQALGVDLYDDKKQKISKEINPLFSFDSFDENQLIQVKEKFTNVSITIAADVANVYYGKSGAAHIFASQKGANEQQIDILDNQLKRVADSISFINLQQTSSSGAAGGIGGALTILGGYPLSGFDLMNKILEIEKYVMNADLIITGEGSIDFQSEEGKLPYKMAELANKHNIPIVALCGKREEGISFTDDMFNGVFAIQTGPVTIEEALCKTASNLELTTKNIMQLIHI